MVTVNGQKINFENGMTVSDALRAAGESPDAMTLVVVEGRVLSRNQLNNELLCDGTHIKLMPILTGG